MKKFKHLLIAIWHKLFSQANKLPRFHRDQTRYRRVYPQFEFGPCTYGMPDVRYWDKVSMLRVGAYCSISKNVQMFLGGNHRTDWISTYPFPFFYPEESDIKDFSLSRGDINIGSDVWLCQDCTILSGITIGHGAVVANGAIVTKDVAPYSIVAGNPAKHIRWRFDDTTRQALLKSAWWNWPEEEVLSIISLLCSGDIAGFLKYAESRDSSQTIS